MEEYFVVLSSGSQYFSMGKRYMNWIWTNLVVAGSKNTYEEIKDYVLEHSGLKVSNLYIAQVKQKCSVIERTNYNLLKSENSRHSKCSEKKEKIIEDVLKHFVMI